MDEVSERLQDIPLEALQALMVRFYHPMQRLQALGGGNVAVRSRATKLLNELMAAARVAGAAG
jgi:hypothetical protein